MREIKFRAWDNHVKEMIYEDNILHYGVSPSRATRRDNRFVIEVLMQYTGLKDKNGKEIYEGDILGREERDSFESEPYWDTCEVKWHRSAWYADFWGNENLLMDDYYSSTGQIIGNIYENPELVK